MERRLAITYIVSATATFGIGCVAIAAAGGGLFVSAAPKPAEGKQVEVVDDYVVIRSSTTIVAAGDAAIAPLDPLATSAVSPPAAISRPLVTSTPATGDAAAVPTTHIDAPEATVAGPLMAAPVAVRAPVAAEPQPADAPEPPEPPAASLPAPAPAAAAPTTSGGRPPIPDGCDNPQFRNGTWNCNDD